jgi:hypothetical protein
MSSTHARQTLCIMLVALASSGCLQVGRRGVSALVVTDDARTINHIERGYASSH